MIRRLLQGILFLLLLGSLAACRDQVDHQQKVSVVNSIKDWMTDIQIDVAESRISGSEKFRDEVALKAKGSRHFSKIGTNLDEIWINPNFDLWRDPVKGSTNWAVVVKYHTSWPQKPFGLTFDARFVESEKLSKDLNGFVRVPHK